MQGRSIKQECIQATLERHLTPYIVNTNVCLRHDQDSSCGALLVELTDVARKIATSTTQLYKINTRGHHTDMVASSVGARLLNILPECIDLIKYSNLYFEYEPHAQLFLDLLQERAFPQYGNYFQSSIKYAPHRYKDMLNGLVDDLRSAAGKRTFLAQLYKRKAAIKTQYENLKEYFRTLDHQHPCAQVISVELGYTGYGRPFYETQEGAYRAMHTHLKTWLIGASQQYHSALVGGAWKLDAGLGSMYKAHAVLIFSGPTSREVIDITRELESLWGRIAGKASYFFSCSDRHHTGFEYRGFDLRFKNTNSVRAELDAYAVYMVASDEYFRLNLNDTESAYGILSTKKKIPNPNKASKRPEILQKTSPNSTIETERNQNLATRFTIELTSEKKPDDSFPFPSFITLTAPMTAYPSKKSNRP